MPDRTGMDSPVTIRGRVLRYLVWGGENTAQDEVAGYHVYNFKKGFADGFF